MLLLSCTNCCFNGLQADGFGARAGYCVEHRAVLHSAESLTCGRQLRRDLLLPEANDESALHQQAFSRDEIVHIRTKASARSSGHADGDISVLIQTAPGKEVTNYGRLGTKIESLARLSMIAGARAELARLSLGRTYVRRCVQLGGEWTSGIHQLSWTIDRLLEPPDVGFDDLWDEIPLPQSRQRELAQWSIVMLRLTFLSDVGYLAPDTDDVAALRDLPEKAASALDNVDVRALMAWIVKAGWAAANEAFPRARYEELADTLHRDPDAPALEAAPSNARVSSGSKRSRAGAKTSSVPGRSRSGAKPRSRARKG
ncbi:MAG TPA: hypothetical protein VNO30_01635 [Kofleriaceae bacterium]|nr:hypothetical protein [Kofleriaceae bacterium]